MKFFVGDSYLYRYGRHKNLIYRMNCLLIDDVMIIFIINYIDHPDPKSKLIVYGFISIGVVKKQVTPIHEWPAKCRSRGPQLSPLFENSVATERLFFVCCLLCLSFAWRLYSPSADNLQRIVRFFFRFPFPNCPFNVLCISPVKSLL